MNRKIYTLSQVLYRHSDSGKGDAWGSVVLQLCDRHLRWALMSLSPELAQTISMNMSGPLPCVLTIGLLTEFSLLLLS
jgi:hypothetical protein